MSADDGSPVTKTHVRKYQKAVCYMSADDGSPVTTPHVYKYQKRSINKCYVKQQQEVPHGLLPTCYVRTVRILPKVFTLRISYSFILVFPFMIGVQNLDKKFYSTSLCPT